MGAMRVVVTGGAGDLGARVVRELRGMGHEALVASRRTGMDLASGEGVAEAIAGADAVIHAASNPTKAQAVDVGGTVHLMDAVRRQPVPPHVVHVSIVGVDRNPYPYYRAKEMAERVIGLGDTPATIVRATQFHVLAAYFARMGAGPVALSIGDMTIQPVDIDWVATRLAQVATGPRPAAYQRHPDLAGPEVFTTDHLSRLIAEHDGRTPPKVVRVPAVGGAMRSFAQGDLVPTGDVETGGRSFQEWLAAQPVPLPRGRH
jgi:uncharacterized protein YbjT (DUF2867 family)